MKIDIIETEDTGLVKTNIILETNQRKPPVPTD